MSGRNRRFGPPTKLISGLYSQGCEYDLETGERIDGICMHCDQWDAELIKGACRHDECKQARLDKKVAAGTAVKYTSDVLNKEGRIGTTIERGKKKFLQRTTERF